MSTSVSDHTSATFRSGVSAVISERELQTLLMATGRPIPLAKLTDWRAQGLLPPFSCPGRGWSKHSPPGAAIALQAVFTYDLLAHAAAPAPALLTLWLAGFDVPIASLRRCWAQRTRRRQSLVAQQTADSTPTRRRFRGTPLAVTGADSSAVLVKTALALCESLHPDEVFADMQVLREVLAAIITRLAESKRDIDQITETSQRVLSLVRVMVSLMESSELMSVASDTEIRRAQNYLKVVAGFTELCLGGRRTDTLPFWSAGQADQLGPPLYILILVLIRSGRVQALDRSAKEIRLLSSHWEVGSGQRRQGRNISSGHRKAKAHFRRRMCVIWRDLLS